MERQLTFIDTDENRLEVLLKDDRIQLSVVDSYPELEAEQLRAFATALFATYAAPPLGRRLADARARLGALRERLAGDATALVALDGALAALDEVARALAATPADSADPPSAPRRPAPVARRRPARGSRACESAPAWFTSSSCLPP